MNNTTKHRGFTLVEIAIVLVIIGLILGGVIKGQALIQQARIKNMLNTVDTIRAAVYGFQDRYGQLPGDENIVGLPVGESGDGNGNGVIGEAASAVERYAIWNDLAITEFISGTYDGIAQRPANPWGGTIDLYNSGAPGPNDATHYFVLTNIPREAAIEIETKYDGDLSDTTGYVRASAPYAGGTTIFTVYIAF